MRCACTLRSDRSWHRGGRGHDRGAGRLGSMGWQVNLVSHRTDNAMDKPGFVAPVGASQQLQRQLKGSGDLMREASVLWLDDHPGHNVVERRFLARAGAWVETVTSTAEAVDTLRWCRFHVVIADMERVGGSPTPEIAKAAKQVLGDTRVVYYVGQVDHQRGVPQDTYGITDRPDELYDLVIRAMELSSGQR